jgi:hypothetical protein
LVSPPGDLHMSAKLTLTVLTALLTAVSIQGTASARGFSPNANDLRSDPAFNRLLGSRALGSINVGPSVGRLPNDIMFDGRAIGRDPDPNVRLQFMRDPANDR